MSVEVGNLKNSRTTSPNLQLNNDSEYFWAPGSYHKMFAKKKKKIVTS